MAIALFLSDDVRSSRLLITVGTAGNIIMALAAILRFHLFASGCSRSLFSRAAIYLSISLAILFVTSFVDAYLRNIDKSVDLIWIVPSLLIAALAITWRRTVVEEKPQRLAVRSAIMQHIQEKYLAAWQDSKAELERQALYDELTGLPNRRLFAERFFAGACHCRTRGAHGRPILPTHRHIFPASTLSQ
jgi:hypothetical protein